MTKLTHNQARRYLHRAADSELGAREQAALDEHLAACPECRAYAAELDQLHATIVRVMRSRWSDARISRDLTEDVIVQFRRTAMRDRTYRAIRPFAGAGVLLMLVVLLIGLVRDYTLQKSGIGSLPLASNGRLIAFVRQDFRIRDSAEIYVMNADGTNPVNLTRNTTDDYNPAWSPDGQRLAFTSERTGRPEIFVMNADGSNVIQLSHDTETGVSLTGALSWSPDGAYLVALVYPVNPPGSYSEGANYADSPTIAIVKSDGSGGWHIPERRVGADSLVCPLGDPYSPPQWSPDGKRIAFIGWRHSADTPFCGASRDLRNDLFVINPDGTGLVNLSRGGESETNAFAWSPDGTRLAYLTFTPLSEFSYRAEIKLVNVDGSGQKTPREVDAPAYRTFTNLQWSPDGTRLLFAPADPRETPQRHLYLIDLTSTELTQLPDVVDFQGIIDTMLTLGYANPTWSPDGKWILYAALGIGPGHIFKLNMADIQAAPDRLKPIQLTFGEETNTNAQWQLAVK